MTSPELEATPAAGRCDGSGQYDAVVLYYKRGPEVVSTVDSLLQQSSPPRQVLIFDNGSNDGLDARDFGDPRVVLHTAPENLGYAGGMNAAVKLLEDGSRWVLLLTHEVLLEQACAASLLRAAEAEGAVVTGPTLMLPTGADWSGGGSVGRRGNTFHRRPVPGASVIETEWVDGAAMLVDAKTFRESGGFDETLYLYWEDVELCLRLASRGPIVIASAARAEQDTSTTPVYFGARNRILVWRRHREWERLVASVLEIVAKITRDVLRGHWSQAHARLFGLRDGLLDRPARLNLIREAR